MIREGKEPINPKELEKIYGGISEEMELPNINIKRIGSVSCSHCRLGFELLEGDAVPDKCPNCLRTGTLTFTPV